VSVETYAPERTVAPSLQKYASVLTVAGLAAGTVGLRLAFLAPRLAHWDAVNYALGLHNFDVAAHQPHPPGSPYFILVGRLALALVGDDNAALQLVSVAASAAAVVLEYVLARLLFGRRAALLAALILMTQPIFWGYGTTASGWTVLALCAIGIAWVSLLLLRGQVWLVYPSAVLIGVVSGFRTDAVAFLAPIWLWGLYTATKSWCTRILAVGVATVMLLVWLVPVAASAGGALAWWERLLALLPADDVRTPRQFAANTAIAFGTLAITLGPAALLTLVARPRVAITQRIGVFLGLWCVPAFTFLWLVDSTEPGHALVFAGALAAVGAGLLGRSLKYGVVVVGLQVSVFLFAAPLADRPLAWTLNSMLLNVTAPGLRQQQTSLDATLQTIRSYPADSTLVTTLVGQDPYRFLMYYVPEYTVVRLDPQAHAVLTAHGGSQDNWREATCLQAARAALLVLSLPTEPGTIPAQATLLSSEAGPFQVWRMPPSEYLGFDVGTCA
jgi:hypothetical protein